MLSPADVREDRSIVKVRIDRFTDEGNDVRGIIEKNFNDMERLAISNVLYAGENGRRYRGTIGRTQCALLVEVTSDNLTTGVGVYDIFARFAWIAGFVASNHL